MKWFRSHIIKKILGLIIILGCSGVFLNGYVGMGESVYAQNENEITAVQNEGGTDDTEASGSLNTMTIWQVLNLLLKIIYIFLWPLLVIAGLSLDNTLVYASIFHMDAPLWKFWNMMKNFANFALGFMVLFAIIKSIISNSGGGSFKDEKSPLGIIKKTLIAGILIQASWFLMAVLIDLSTIATYAVGGLPLSILKNDPIGDMQIITVNSVINLDKFDILSAGGQGFDVSYTLTYKGTGMDVSPCRIEGTSTGSFVIGRVKGGKEYKNSEKFTSTDYKENELCVLNGNTIVMWKEDKLMEGIANYIANNGPPETWSDEVGYNSILKKFLKDTGWIEKDFVKEYAVKLGGSTPGSDAGLTTGKDFLKDKDTATMQLSQLIDKSKGFVGPLATIYSSLLNFGQLTDTDITSVGETSGIFIIKTGIALALFFPLLALALVLIARIGLLWLFIVASPFIILKESFSKLIPLGKLDEYLSIQGIMGIIFAPVVSVAALSLSLIFLTALINGFNSNNINDSTRIEQTFGVEKITAIDEQKNDAFKIGGSSKIEFTKLPRGNQTLDWFSWLLINFFAIGLMWMIVFAAIRANVLGKKIGGSIEKFGGNMFKTLPIIPTGNGESVGIGSMAKVLADSPNRYLNDMNTKDNENIGKWLEGKTELDKEEVNTIFNENNISLVKEKMMDSGIKQKNIDTVISNNQNNISEALATIKDPKDKKALMREIVSLSDGKLKIEDLEKSTKKIETKIALDDISTGLTDETAVKGVFKTPTGDAATKINAYFAAGATDYMVTTIAPDNKTYKIEKDPVNDGQYTVTLITIPTPTE